MKSSGHLFFIFIFHPNRPKAIPPVGAKPKPSTVQQLPHNHRHKPTGYAKTI
jgi:hypothetical protein